MFDFQQFMTYYNSLPDASISVRIIFSLAVFILGGILMWSIVHFFRKFEL